MPRRPGRPRMSETAQGEVNTEARRARMRLAQRSYRNRKQNALVIAKTRAEVFERALDSSIDEFIQFYEGVSKKKSELPDGFFMELNKTAMNIVSIARKARTEHSTSASDESRIIAEWFSAPGRDVAGANRYSRHNEPTAGSSSLVPVSQRLLLACLARAMDLLQFGNLHVLALNPTMLLPLKFDRVEDLLERTSQRLSGNPNASLADCLYSEGRNAYLPKMMRLVEGNLSTLQPRSSPPALERLEFGLTRTMLHAINPEFQGEWLEAPDVEEYLEQRGIFVRMGSPSDVIRLSAPPSNEPSSAGRASIPEHDWTIFGRTSGESQVIPIGFSDFAKPEGYLGVDFTSNKTATGPEEHQDLRITVDLDKLIRGLAEKAICLGPCPGIRRVHVDEAIRASVTTLRQPVK
ncbi:hypothetical protein TRIATDRAFT_46438 [Trichoderma atroviride IMI 206040]|uniref:BZIP domain-containing protein n=1 Tax=Hypocrea atroviridis (strain ATCC 20476 / IMI 206040) TaxID=452589 RepID=G9NQQ9_HYPAI|nr:uncharacterized protein TRIATDRAFT_46438 [Trichoderma atroviride IMI 206040]EHK46881.1 hypothetical protein TRIATDRAFT_46438 [Trichoderma atroviride IMI 206040]